MYAYYFTFRSVTAAQYGARVLKQLGLKNAMQRLPRAVQTQGCGYWLGVREADYGEARAALRQQAAAVLSILRRRPDGGWETVP